MNVIQEIHAYFCEELIFLIKSSNLYRNYKESYLTDFVYKTEINIIISDKDWALWNSLMQ